MLGHIGVNVPDLRAAKTYYDAIMPLVGFEPFLEADDEFAYRPMSGKPGTYLFFYAATEDSAYSRHRTGLQHLAFMLRTRAAVIEVHRAVAELASRFGGRVLHEPRHFPQYPAALLRDVLARPVGLMLEAVCHHDRE